MADDDRHEATQAVAAFFHHKRAEAKKRAKKWSGTAPMRHDANTDWWNYIPGGKKRR